MKYISNIVVRRRFSVILAEIELGKTERMEIICGFQATNSKQNI